MIATSSRKSIALWDFEGSGFRGINPDETSAENGGDDAWQVAEGASDIVVSLCETATWQRETLEEEFARHAEKWRAETGFMSSVRDMATHPSYQHIIGMGRDAVPLIIRELRKNPDHWFWALNAITGVDPVPACDRGKVERMRDAWMDWGDTQDASRL